MKIGFFTDTYFPQVSGVSTSIRTLKTELENLGHEVYIFTTTDPEAIDTEENIIRMPSIPFVSFKERRIVVRGMLYAYNKAKEIGLDIVHTHTEFGVGLLGKQTAKSLNIPVVHTYHTMYEDYLHYVGKGKIIRPQHVKQLVKMYMKQISGVICPSQRVVDMMIRYEVDKPMAIIPTGIDVTQFRPCETNEITAVRSKYGIDREHLLLLSISRISFEKNIQTILKGMPQIIESLPNVRLLIVGDGPYKANLECLTAELDIESHVIFAGEVPNEMISPYYQAADYFVSASDSETQGLTYTEAMAAKTKVVAKGNPYLESLFDNKSLGCTYQENEDFSKALIQYVIEDQEMDLELLNQKLYDISSEAFGIKVENFYEKTLREYNEKIYAEADDLDYFKLFKKKEYHD